jgi:signal transduction histidine kinase/DNA-binding response OmpR family regulator
MSESAVLNVDDNAANRYVKSRVLRQAGFQVLEAATGESALRLAVDSRPDLVLLDINLPDISGLDVARRLRQDPQTRGIPIIHISATFVTPRDEATSRESGADFYLPEPVGPDELKAAVRTLVRLRAMEQGFAISEERMRLATESAGIATWEMDVATGAMSWSRQLYEFFGYNESRTPPSVEAWLERVRPAERAAFAAALEQARAGKAPLTLEHSIEREDDCDFRCLAPYGRLHAAYQAGPTRLIGVVTDVTERRRAESEREALLEQARVAQRAAEDAARMKDEFLATLSHELRTPMSAVLGWLQVIRSGKLPPEQHAIALDTIERNARLQTQLVDDLLDVSRIVTGKLQIESIPVLVHEVAAAAAESARPSAQARGITLVAAVEGAIGPVLGSPERLQQVFSNLIANAIKFTPAKGRVEVRVDQIDGNVRTRIIDTGEGIAPELLPHIFDRFRQADSSTRRLHGGLGLGLAIVRSLVELHGGQVAAESAGPGRGATFSVTLPLVGALADAYLPQPREDGESEGLSDLHLLVLDDNTDAATMLASMLRLEGAEVDVAHRPAQALAAAMRRKPDLLLLDIGMPGEDGYDFLQRLRRELGADADELPAIAITGYASTEDKVRAFTSGFQGHLAKPFQAADLFRLVRMFAAAR